LARAVDGKVATITLDRPEARNALNGAMCEDLRRAAMTAAADEEVKIVFVRGAGPVFCAGADLKERQGKTGDDIRARRIKGFAAYHALESLPMPAIAIVHGAALGSGVEIAAACDFIVATPDAVFGTPEVLRGTVGATQRLPRVLGKRLAKDMMFTGRKLTAEEVDGDVEISIDEAAEPSEGDEVIEHGEARVFLDPAAAEVLDDQVLGVHARVLCTERAISWHRHVWPWLCPPIARKRPKQTHARLSGA